MPDGGAMATTGEPDQMAAGAQIRRGTALSLQQTAQAGMEMG
jgi:hypothetical protein